MRSIPGNGRGYGMRTFISKLGTSLSVFISGLILSAGGYIVLLPKRYQFKICDNVVGH
jgi:Na+/melibiose symporter-like transporter